MSTMRHIENRLVVLGLAVLFVIPSFVAAAEQPPPTAKNSDELLLEIMEIHSQLVTNELFLAQAKVIGAYLEAALQFDEPKKAKAYSTVLGIVSQIKNTGAPFPTQSKEPQERADVKPTHPESADSKTVYEPGSALLEIFNASSMDKVPDVPTIRTYWQRDLAYKGDFLLPGREAQVGVERQQGLGGRHPVPDGYVAKFAFYYQARQPGRYGFTVIHSRFNECVLKIGGADVLKTQAGAAGQGDCGLEKGFHRVEFWIATRWPPVKYERDPGCSDFEVRVMSPDGFDSLPLTKDMMLLKKEQKEKADTHQGEKAKGQPLPYVDY
jgi:hypothetical protein